ncbi:MAG: TlpA disulfide reductase family protein [Bacteroidota bacterium]
MIAFITSVKIAVGIWRAFLMTPGGELPFEMEVKKTDSAYVFSIKNGPEKMELEQARVSGDSLFVRFPVYESELRLKVGSERELEGYFINLTRTTNATIPMRAYHNAGPRFYIRSKEPSKNIHGRWSVVFGAGTKDSTYAVGLFEQDGGVVNGTFLTSSGDYRYLEGVVDGDSLFLSAFDGVFVYLFKAKVKTNTLEGVFYSGTHRQIAFTGSRDAYAKLPDPTAITSYNLGNKPFSITFPDTDSVIVSLSDARFKDKVVIIQILGSWCPNCLDESEFLQEYYVKNKDRGVEVIGLSFEKTDDFNKAASNVKRLRSRLGITYPMLVCSNRDKVQSVLPGLENFKAFPTSIYLDRNHRVRKIYSGFSGKATGVEFERFKDDFTLFLDKLLLE